jgi:hypothetical protein
MDFFFFSHIYCWLNVFFKLANLTVNMMSGEARKTVSNSVRLKPSIFLSLTTHTTNDDPYMIFCKSH